MKHFFTALTALAVAALGAGCLSGNVAVADENYFSDSFEPEKGLLQLVEVYENTALSEPTADRFRKNCADAETRARSRFNTLKPQAKDEGRRLSEHFEKNAACKVRMVFKVN